MPQSDKNQQGVRNRATSRTCNQSAMKTSCSHKHTLLSQHVSGNDNLMFLTFFSLCPVLCLHARISLSSELFCALFNEKNCSCADGYSTLACQRRQKQTEMERAVFKDLRRLRLGFVATVAIPDAVFIRRPLYIYFVMLEWFGTRD